MSVHLLAGMTLSAQSEEENGVPKVMIVKIRHYFWISKHSQCIDQEYTLQVNGEAST